MTPFAKKLIVEHELDVSKIPHEGEKVTLADVKAFLGQPVAKKSDAFTAAARKLAAENSLSETDFDDESRSGKIRKTGGKEINLADVKKVLGIVATPKSNMSPKVKELVEKNNLDISEIVGTGVGGKILKVDLEGFLTSPKPKTSKKKKTTKKEETNEE